MDDQLDDDLKKRIKEVFENYQDTSADEGWLLLRERYPEKRKRRPVAWIWWGAAAALLLLFLGIFWFKQAPEKNQQLSGIKRVPTKIQPPASGEKKVDRDHDSTVIESPRLTENKREDTSQIAVGKHIPTTAIASDNNRKAVAPGKRNNINLAEAKNPAAATQNNVQKDNTLPAKTAAVLAVIPPPAQGKTPSASQNEAVAKTDSGNKSQIKPYSGVIVPGINMADQQKNNANKQLFANSPGPSKTEKTGKDDKNVRFSVYAATYFNYAKGSDNQFNMGAGFTSDIKLSKKLQFSTGLSIGQNSLNYASQPPVMSTANVSTLALNSYAPASLKLAGTPAFKNYSANLVGLDIPLNLKFTFDPQKTQTYILAGLSSGTFINETYTYSYDNPSLYSTNISQVQDQSTRNTFSSFYFAKALNLAFGTGYNVGRNRLVIEPFLKYPLQGLGSQDIRFGAGGINLKFNFQPPKK